MKDKMFQTSFIHQNPNTPFKRPLWIEMQVMDLQALLE